MDATIRAFLDAGGYATMADWARDSDYHQSYDGEWVDEWGHTVFLEGCIEGAIEASGFTPPKQPKYDRLAVFILLCIILLLLMFVGTTIEAFVRGDTLSGVFLAIATVAFSGLCIWVWKAPDERLDQFDY